MLQNQVIQQQSNKMKLSVFFKGLMLTGTSLKCGSFQADIIFPFLFTSE